MNKNKTLTHPVITAFNTRARWNLFGSIMYEGLRIGHSAIIAMLFAPEIFGLVGSLFASTYLVVRLSDAGATNALLPFFGYIEQSRQTFKDFFLKRIFLSLFITAPLGAGAASIILYRSQLQDLSSCAIILPILMFSETLRSFLRQFLHLAGQSKKTLIIDHVTFCLYVAACWPTLFYVPNLRTPLFIFGLFLIDSLIGLSSFLVLTNRYAKKLPDKGEETPPTQPSWHMLITSRLYAWLMRVCKELLSSNALTPLFAATVGLKQAGLFYFAATLAMALHAVMRSVIGYAGACLFISARKTALPTHEAFALVSRKLTSILLVLAGFFIFTYHDIVKLTLVTAASSLITIFFVLYFAIVIIEFSLFLYEQQYQIEQAGAKALQWRLLELLLVYVAARGLLVLNPISTLVCILMAKVGTLIALALTGYRRWGIVPSLRMPLQKMINLVIVSFCLAIVFKVLIYYALHLI
jgi:hypothetical protein